MNRVATTSSHDWLSLITQHGLFVSEPVIQSEFPEGVESIPYFQYRKMRKQWEKIIVSEDEDQKSRYNQWIDHILEEQLKLRRENWRKGSAVPDETKHYMFEYDQEISPSRVFVDAGGKPLLLVLIVPPGKKLEKPEAISGRWKVSPYLKMTTLCMETKVPLGLLTNGDEFRLVHVKPTTGSSYFEWRAQDWYDEKALIDSFYTFLNRDRFFGKEKKRLLNLIEESQKRQLDVTDQLGEQMRNALSIFVRAIGDLNKDNLNQVFKDVTGQRLYEMSLTVMMRIVFILYSEENGLLPHGHYLYENNYGISHLIHQLKTKANDDDYMRRRDAWPRLLACFRLIYEGCEHPDVNTIAYGGELFDPEKYTELEDHRLNLDNRTIWNILQNLGYAVTKIGKEKVKQKVSYRTIDVEQIGSVYESLIGYSVEMAKETMVTFSGGGGAIRPLSEFEDLPDDELIDYLNKMTGKTVKSIEKILDDFKGKEVGVYEDKGHDEEESDDIRRFSPLIEDGGVIERNQLFIVRAGSIRKGSGTYYTPKEITRFLVRESLEPLVYEENEEGKFIKNPREILDIKVCDPAMGSGAFLVQAINFLGEKLVESWSKIYSQNPDEIITIPFGDLSIGDEKEEILPENEDDSLQKAKLFIAQNCIYGVDLNPMAVELAKVSIWLTTMSKERPLTFLDHHLKCGNSLLGTNFSQVRSIPTHFLWEEVREINNKIIENKSLFDYDFNEYINEILDFRQQLNLKEIEFEDIKRKEKLFKNVHKKDKPLEIIKKIFNYWSSIIFWPEKDNISHMKTNEKKNYNAKLFDFIADNKSYLSVKEIKNNEKIKDPLPPPHTGLFKDIAMTILKLHNTSYNVSEINEYVELMEKLSVDHKFFHWDIEFPEVLLGSKSGFDAIIGNPPYIQFQSLEEEYRNGLKKLYDEYYESQSDIWYYFVYNSKKVLKNNGILSFITSRYYISATHAKKLRKEISNNFKILSIIDFCNYQVFKGIGIHTNIFLLQLERNKHLIKNNIMKYLILLNNNENIDVIYHNDKYKNVSQEDFNKNPWVFMSIEEKEIIQKIKLNSINLSDISSIGTGIKTGYDSIFIVDSNTIKENSIESNGIKKWVKNSEIKKYSIAFKDKYVIYTHKGFNKNNNPNIMQYLYKYKDDLEKKWISRNEKFEWFKLYRGREYLFLNTKNEILCPYKARKNYFALNNNNYCGSGDIYAIKLNDDQHYNIHYILSVLNSKIIQYYYFFYGKRKGNLFEFYTEPLSDIPIKKIDQTNQMEKNYYKSLIEISEHLTESNDVNSDLLENIDNILYELYEFDRIEIDIINKLIKENDLNE